MRANTQQSFSATNVENRVIFQSIQSRLFQVIFLVNKRSFSC